MSVRRINTDHGNNSSRFACEGAVPRVDVRGDVGSARRLSRAYLAAFMLRQLSKDTNVRKLLEMRY